MLKIQKIGCFCVMAALAAVVAAQTVETKDGVRLVHNKKAGLWGGSPRVRLVPVRKIGDVDTDDDNYAFNTPQDLAIDPDGNFYVLDGRNFRIQKFDKDGKFLASFGRKGQGPGEFNMPGALECDGEGRLWVSDIPGRVIIFGPDGQYIDTLKPAGPVGGDSITARYMRLRGFKLLKSGKLLVAEEGGGPSVVATGGGTYVTTQAQDDPDRKLMKILDPATGEILRRFGELQDDKDAQMKSLLNQVRVAVDDNDQVYAAFPHQNRVEKYSPDGRVLWRADRVLDLKLEVLDKGGQRSEGNRLIVSGPSMTSCVVGLGVDGRGRTWVVAKTRELKPEEELGQIASVGPSGVMTKIEGNRDLRTTDAYKLEIFGPDGGLLGEIPLTTFVDEIFVFGDRLFLLDQMRGVCFHEFKIVEAD